MLTSVSGTVHIAASTELPEQQLHAYIWTFQPADHLCRIVWVFVPLQVHLQSENILSGYHNFKGVFEGSSLVLRLM